MANTFEERHEGCSSYAIWVLVCIINGFTLKDLYPKQPYLVLSRDGNKNNKNVQRNAILSIKNRGFIYENKITSSWILSSKGFDMAMSRMTEAGFTIIKKE